ncbi:hypothetical protein B0H14DRAFT_2699483 [Mycena olivaceomarginata]|nr:hypothetical protein B0H14DRAFT_2699483 [Mycena olivaceomarginata]
MDFYKSHPRAPERPRHFAPVHGSDRAFFNIIRACGQIADGHVSTMIADSDKIFAPTRISPVLAELPKPLSLSPLPFSSVESSSLVWLSGSAADENGHLLSIWADRISCPTVTRRLTVLGESRIQADIEQQFSGCAKTHGAEQQRSKTLAQRLLENDSDADDQIFTMIGEEICVPTWMTPVVAERPKAPSLSPPSTVPSHSRCGSSSSTPSSDVSFSSYENGVPRQSRRERSRQAHAYVDTSKKEVIPYAGGKTTVLTGGVMLGDGPKRVVHCPEPWTTSM